MLQLECLQNVVHFFTEIFFSFWFLFEVALKRTQVTGIKEMKLSADNRV